MERKVLNLEQHVTFLYDELEKKEEEIDNLKNKLDEAIDKARQKAATHLKDQDDISEMKKVIGEQKVKIMCLRKHRDDILNRHENTIDDYEKEFKEKEADIKRLQEIINDQKKDVKDLTEECFDKSQKIIEKEAIIKQFQSNNSKSSLSEELTSTEKEKEKQDFITKIDNLTKSLRKSKNLMMKKNDYIKEHDEIFEKMKLNIKTLQTSVENLKKQEHGKIGCELGWLCNRIFCQKDHTFLYKKLNPRSTTPFRCRKCEINFENSQQLWNHTQLQHEIPSIVITCGKCSFKCNKKQEFKKHVHSEHERLNTRP